MKQIFLLVDCNNFFVSCERIFNPKLLTVPVVVLSNNDGCIISRSNEAKTLGIPMGAPVYQVQDILRRHRVQVFSSNYYLYGEISRRVMQILGQIHPMLEVYSIDEAFMVFTQQEIAVILDYAQQIRYKIWQELSIPVSIGIASTMTLAKLANRLAKQNVHNPIYSLWGIDCSDILSQVKVSDVWGVGRRWAKRLAEYGIDNAQQLCQANPKLIRQKFNIFLARTQYELRGESCRGVAIVSKDRKSIAVTRSFSDSKSEYSQLEEAVTLYLSRLAEKLRRYHLQTRQIFLFVRTSVHAPLGQRTFASTTCFLPCYTNDTTTILDAGILGLKKIYTPGTPYRKAGVIACFLQSENIDHAHLFQSNSSNNPKLMSLMDQINQRYGRGSISYAITGLHRNWLMKSNFRSPDYLSSWEELLRVG